MRRGLVSLAALLLLLSGCRGQTTTVGVGPVPKGKVRLTWYGAAMFLARDSDMSVLVNPYGPHVGYIVPRVSARIVLVSNDGYDARDARLTKKGPRVIDGIGEAYVGDFAVLGVPSRQGTSGSAAREPNAIYYWEMGGVSLAHMGDFGQAKLSSQQAGLLRGVDILMMPVGGRTVADARTAGRIARQIGPKIVIPMDYRTPAVVANLAPVEAFSSRFATIRRVGDTIEVGPADLPAETEVWVMKYKQETE